MCTDIYPNEFMTKQLQLQPFLVHSPCWIENLFWLMLNSFTEQQQPTVFASGTVWKETVTQKQGLPKLGKVSIEAVVSNQRVHTDVAALALLVCCAVLGEILSQIAQ